MIETIRTILVLLPAIIRAVQEIEMLFPESGQGQMKLALIRESLAAVTEVGSDMLPLIERIIDTVVRVFNELGIFKS